MTDNQKVARRIFIANHIFELSRCEAPEGSDDAAIQQHCMRIEAEIHYLKEELQALDADVLAPEFLGNNA